MMVVIGLCEYDNCGMHRQQGGIYWLSFLEMCTAHSKVLQDMSCHQVTNIGAS